SRLISYAADAMPEPAGRIVDELPAIRSALIRALGIGTGGTREVNVGGSNRRGRVVELAPALARELDTPFALTVTEPTYSRVQRQQTVIPLLDAREFEARDLDVRVAGADWTRKLRGRPAEVLLAVSMIFTVYQPAQIGRFTDAAADDGTMAGIDQALGLHFGF
ncbi:MAG TPA: hypothetical protein VFQ45_00295, partial [Longimicrobium sp.]|nr:hypothetical protein [Longimicrobium sp.]